MLEYLGLVLIVAILWGCTNPFIERAVHVKPEEFKPYDFSIRSLLRIMTRVKFLLPFGINQLGSIVYMYVLGKVPAHYCSVLANSLTSVITLLTETFLNKERWTKNKIAGLLLILVGIPLVLT
jgi:drug/metabolite transporter (DMT)-like permease